MKKVIILILYSTFLVFTLSAQDYLGISAGTSHYFGDLAKHTDRFSTGDTKAVIGIDYQKSVYENLYLSAALNIGALSADDFSSDIESHRNRSYDFRSFITELQFLMVYRLFAIELNTESTIKMNISTGVSALKCKTSHSSTVLRNLVSELENPSKIGFAIPVNVSLDIDMRDVTYFIQGEARKSFTDYLDGLSVLTESAANDTYGFIKLGARIPIKTNK